MSRRSRNSRAWRYVWGGIRQDADARALVLASESEEWSYDRLEVSTQPLNRHKGSEIVQQHVCRHVMPAVCTVDEGNMSTRRPGRFTSGVPVRLKAFSVWTKANVWCLKPKVELFTCFVSDQDISPQKGMYNNGSLLLSNYRFARCCFFHCCNFLVTAWHPKSVLCSYCT